MPAMGAELPDPALVRQRLARWRQCSGLAGSSQLAMLEALARRADACTGPRRQRLERRLAQLCARLDPVLDAAAPAPARPAAGALAEVTARLDAIARARHGQAGDGAEPEMAMLGELRRLWMQVRSDSQLRRSLQDLPEDAGPLNSGKLVHRALNLAGELSPPYLRHFLAHLDALAWIAQVPVPAVAPAAAPGAGTPRRARTRTRRKPAGTGGA